MIDYDWEYDLICDECGAKRKYHAEALQDVLKDAKNNGWHLEAGVHLCRHCFEEKQMPCKDCESYSGDVCTNYKSTHCADFVLPTMHCEWWKRKGQ